MTPITIEQTAPFKERILLFGGGGAGKSTAVLDIARHCPESTFWVADNDTSFSYERLLYTEYQDVLEHSCKAGIVGDDGVYIDGVELFLKQRGNVVVVELGPSWDEFMAFNHFVIGRFDSGKFSPGEADPNNDWWIVDSVTSIWQYVQSWYSDQVHGEDLATHMLNLRKEASDLKEYNKLLTGDMTWPLINKVYDQFIRIMHRWRGHALVTATVSNLMKDDSMEEHSTFGRIALKPAGQKNLFHQFGTNLYLYNDANGWYMKTAKERGREVVWGESVESFANDYLVKVAGWKISQRKTGAKS